MREVIIVLKVVKPGAGRGVEHYGVGGRGVEEGGQG